MNAEAVGAGFYAAQLGTQTQQFPKIQVVTIEQLLSGDQPKMPLLANPYQQAVKGKTRLTDQDSLL